MKIEVKEICEVSYINEETADLEEGRNLKAIRTVIYESEGQNLLEAIIDYTDNFDGDRIVESDDDFDGECLTTLDYLSFKQVN